MKLTIDKRPDGKLNIKGLAIWSKGTFHGYGSPPEGDTFNSEDLEAMAKAHKEIGSKIRPRVYPGHKLNPLLKLLARPKGEITRLYTDGEFLYADIEGVDPEFWKKATEDGARFSPDVKFGYVDPKTGKKYDKVIVGLGVLGAAHPANPELPPLDEYVTNYYAAAYGDGEVRGYVSAPAKIPPYKRDDLEDVPDGVYLDPANKKYPVKRKKDGKWEYNLSDLQDAYRLAKMHGKTEIAEKAKGIMKREFGYEMGDSTKPRKKTSEAKSYAGSTTKEEVMADKNMQEPTNVSAPDVAAELASFEEKLASYAAQLEEERKARIAAEEAAKKAEEAAIATAQILEHQLIEKELEGIASFVDGLVKEMKVPPAAAEKVQALLVAAAGVDGEIASYALGDVGDEMANQSLLELAKSVFEAFPAPENVEKSAKEAAKVLGANGINVRAYASDPEAGRVVRERIEAYRKENPGASYVDALNAVLSGL